ncbi:MAG: hypothetical protein LBV15_02535, partial [Planctomycetota bacterium]|nr:hypothetical protein [Planctomycetota bacterium]
MRVLSTGFYMLLSILGLSVISLGGLVGVQLFRGELSPADLHGVMRVIGGADRIMIPSAVYNRFLEYAKDEEAARAELESNRGLPRARTPEAMQAQDLLALQREELELAKKQIEEQKAQFNSLRAELEARKRQVEALNSSLDDERKKNAMVNLADDTQKLRKTLAEMDAGNIAAFLANIIRDPSQGGAPEAARIIRQHLKADFSAEVLGEMPEPERQRVLPLLENPYAGVPPEA